MLTVHLHSLFTQGSNYPQALAYKESRWLLLDWPEMVIKGSTICCCCFFFYMRLTQDKLCDYQLVIYLFSIQLTKESILVLVSDQNVDKSLSHLSRMLAVFLDS